MTVLLHHGQHGAGRHHRAAHHWFTAAPVPVDVPGTGERRAVDARVFAVHRLGATIVGLALLAFGLLGLTSGVPFLTTHGERFLGLSSDGLLSTVSVVVAGLLVGAAARGPRAASTAMLVLGALFLVSALGNLAVLRTGLDLLAFQLSNVVFSVVVGLLLLLLGAYGRITGNLPDDSPYAHPHARAPEPPDQASTTGGDRGRGRDARGRDRGGRAPRHGGPAAPCGGHGGPAHPRGTTPLLDGLRPPRRSGDRGLDVLRAGSRRQPDELGDAGRRRRLIHAGRGRSLFGMARSGSADGTVVRWDDERGGAVIEPAGLLYRALRVRPRDDLQATPGG